MVASDELLQLLVSEATGVKSLLQAADDSPGATKRSVKQFAAALTVRNAEQVARATFHECEVVQRYARVLEEPCEPLWPLMSFE